MAPSTRQITLSPWLETSSLVWATGFAVMLVTLQFLPAAWHQLLWYDRQAIADGELWRLLTGNFVHLGWAHLALNVGALLIGTWLFHSARSPVGWIFAVLVSAIVSSGGLYLFSPEILWCVGMSGAMHGLLMIGAIDWIRQGDRVGWALVLIWTSKLAYEQWQGALPLSTETVGSPVVTDAHLWGAVGGLIYVAAERLWVRFARRPVHAA